MFTPVPVVRLQIVKQEADVSSALAAPKGDMKSLLTRAVNPNNDFQNMAAVGALNAAVDLNTPPATLKNIADSAIVMQHSQPDSLGAATSGSFGSSKWLQVCAFVCQWWLLNLCMLSRQYPHVSLALT